MDLLAYKTTGLALKLLTTLSRARVTLHDQDKVPKTGGTIFVINHFTRLETLLLPYYISEILDRPVWSLAAEELFSGVLGLYLDKVGAISVGDPERDRLIIGSLIRESAPWIIFPEGCMVKNRKVVRRGDFLITTDFGRYPPHTGAAALALRAEILRRRLNAVPPGAPIPAELAERFELNDPGKLTESIHLVPVNVSYYPLRFTDTLLGRLFPLLEEKLSPRVAEELVVEGSMLLEGVDIDIRFGRPLPLDYRVRAFYGERIPDFNPSRRNRRFLEDITREYMAAIYGQTTVNIDHLLAGLLYKSLRWGFSEESLRRRAFLAATSDWRGLKLHPHRGLVDRSQVDLLIARDEGRVENLFNLAREKGLLLPVEGKSSHWRFTGNLKECDGSAFHRVRLENPLLVMANTIEPLVVLQKMLRRLNWTPDWFLRRRTAKRIAELAKNNYVTARKAFAGEAGLCPVAVGSPGFWRRHSKVGIVLVHDWLAAPGGLRPLAEYLARQGFSVALPRLPGHGTVSADLEGRDYEQWLDAIDEAYAWVAQRSRKVVVAGAGRSAALVLLAASRGLNVQVLLALFPVFGVDLWGEPGCPAEKEGFCYRQVPSFSRSQARKMLVQAARRLDQIKIPLLMIEAESSSRTLKHRGERYLARLGSSEKELLRLPFPDLAALVSGRAAGARAMINFVKRNLYRD